MRVHGMMLLVLAVLAVPAHAADYYLRTSGANSNDGLTPATAWATLNHAYRQMSAGDTLYIGSGTYVQRLTAIGRNGKANAPIRFIGDVSGSRTGDAGSVIIEQNGGSIVSVRANYIELINLDIVGRGSRGASVPLRWDDGTGGLVRHCRIENAQSRLLYYGGRGTLTIESTTLRDSDRDGVYANHGRIELRDCIIEDISQLGATAQNSGSSLLLERCTLSNIGNEGVRAENGSADLIATLIDGTTNIAVRAHNGQSRISVLGCTILDTRRGVYAANGSAVIRNTIFSGIALNAIEAQNSRDVENSHNLFWEIDGATHLRVSSGGGDVEADPMLVPVPGADAGLDPGSPAVDAGADLTSDLGSVGGAALDLLGALRPNGIGWDIGAVESGGSAAYLRVPYADGFEGDLHEAWSDRSADRTSALGGFMGPFGMNETTRPSTTARVLTTPGERYVLRFDGYVFDGWEQHGPYQDDMIVEIDGVEVLRTSFDHNNPDDPAGNQDGYGRYAYAQTNDRIFRDLSVTFTASGGVTELRMRGEHTGNGEGWGVDNVSIVVDDAAETPFFDSFEAASHEAWDEDHAFSGHEDLSRYAGPFGAGESASLTVRTVPGTVYTLGFDLFVLNDWDGESFDVLVNGSPVFSQVFELGTSPRVGGRAPDHATDADNDGLTDLIYRVVTTTFVAEDHETVIRFESGLDEASSDEAFGLDSVMVLAGTGTLGLDAAWVDHGAGIRRLSDLAFGSPTHTSVESHIGWINQHDEFYPDGPDQQFGVRVEGQIVIPSTGSWRFRLGSDDGSRLDLNGSTLINNDGVHSFRYREATTTLEAGTHGIVAEFFENSGWKGFVLQWQGPSMASWETVPGWAFRRGSSAFTDVSAELGFDLDTGASAGSWGGIAFVDLDHDGDLDAVAGGVNGAVLEQAGGVFTPARRADLRGQIALFDADRDGRLDVYRPLAKRFELHGGRLALMVGLGDGGFAEPTGSPSAVAADLNADGRADLLSFADNGNYRAIMLDAEDENDPFDIDVPIIGSAGLNDVGDYGLGGFVAAADANGDGLLDFYFDRAGGRLFLSNGDGTYLEDQTLVAGSASGVGAAWADFDNDGDMDLLVPGRGSAPRLWRNESDAFAFTDVAAAAGLTTTADQRSAAWGDADNDGDLDIYLTTASGEPNELHLNNGDGTFSPGDLVPSVLADTLDAAWGDYDADGDMDLALLTDGGLMLMRNDLDRADTLRVVAGPAMNRRVAAGAIGARIELFDDAGTRIGVRELGVARGTLAGPFEATFSGIDTARAHRVVVTWPGGATSTAEVVPQDTSATLGGVDHARTLDIAALRPPGVRIVRWNEVSPTDE